MCRLLVLADPGPLALHPDRALGHVITVVEDGCAIGDHTRKHQPVIDVPGMPVEEAEAIYLVDGVPLELKQAAADAEAAFNALLTAKEKDEKAIAEARLAATAAKEATKGWPWRAKRIDLAKLAPAAIDCVLAHRAAIESCRAEAKAAAKSAVLSEWSWQKGRDLTPGEIATETKDIIDGLGRAAVESLNVRDRGQAYLLDQKQDAIKDASREAYAMVMDPFLDAVPVPDLIVVDAETLANFTVDSDPVRS